MNHFLTPLEKIASLIACLGHDMGHRGYNNVYHDKLKTKLSYAYYGNGILENLHVSLLLRLLERPDINIWGHIEDQKSKSEFKELIISVILGTDMAKHFKHLSTFSE